MIAKLRRLERLRARQLDRARAEHVRQGVACERAADEQRAAITGFDGLVGRAIDLLELESAGARIDAAHDAVQRNAAAHEATRQSAAATGQAWSRAEQALAHARAEREAEKRKDEQREHDELAGRRSR